MRPAIKSYMNWSGGKDSSLCLYRILQDKNYSVETLLTSVNAAHNRISMHGVRRELLNAQAELLGIPLQTIELPEQPDMTEYDGMMGAKVAQLRNAGYTTAVFGDIFLEDLKHYREQRLARENIKCIFPLWKNDTGQLMNEFLSLGFKAVVVCVNEQYLDKSFCGRMIDESFINDLPANVDICGENGEYHSFVFDGPIFRHPVPYRKGEIVCRNYQAPNNQSATNNGENNDLKYNFFFCDLH